MQCELHPNAKLETNEVVKKIKLPWSEEMVEIYHDIESCPCCFESYAEGNKYQNKLIKGEPNETIRR